MVSYYSTNLWHKGIHEIAAEGARNHGLLNIAPADFFETKLMIPQDIEEQKKIGKYFEHLDRLITLHQRIIYKFSEKLTFTWEQRKVSEITSSYSGGTPKAGTTGYYDGDIPFIRSGEIYGNTTELFITEEGLNSSSAKMVHIGDILYALYGATSGEVSRARLDGAINQAILAIIPNDEVNADFLVEWFRKEKAQITDKYLQGGQGNLSAQIIKNLKVTIPVREAQNKIGEYFSMVNYLITLHQRNPCNLNKFMAFDWEQRKFSEITIRESTIHTSRSGVPSVEYEDVVAEDGRLNKDIRLKETEKSGVAFDGSQVLYGKLRPYLHNWLNPDFTGIAVGDWWVLKPINTDKKVV